jgi:hypothetical protein
MAGSRSTSAREPGQVRKEAALSGPRRAMRGRPTGAVSRGVPGGRPRQRAARSTSSPALRLRAAGTGAVLGRAARSSADVGSARRAGGYGGQVGGGSLGSRGERRPGGARWPLARRPPARWCSTALVRRAACHSLREPPVTRSRGEPPGTRSRAERRRVADGEAGSCQWAAARAAGSGVFAGGARSLGRYAVLSPGTRCRRANIHRVRRIGTDPCHALERLPTWPP